MSVQKLREQADGVQELRRLQVREAGLEVSVSNVGDGLQQHGRHVFANDGSGLEQPLLDRQTVDASGKDGLNRLRNLYPFDRGLGERIRPRARRTSRPVSTSVRTLSSRKNGLPSVRSISTRLQCTDRWGMIERKHNAVQQFV